MARSEEQSPSHSSLSDSHLERASRQRRVVAAAATPVDAAGVRVLVVPVGRVRASKAAEWTNAIAQFSQLPLADVLGHAGDAVLAGYAGGLDTGGSVRFAFTSAAGGEHEHLEGLQTYRQVLGVIGVVDCVLSDDVGAAYNEFLHVISRHTTAVAYRCLAFDLRADQQDDVPGVTVVPSTGRLLFYLQTLLCDFAATMLGALGLMAQSIEDRADLQSSTSSSPDAAHFGSPREAAPPAASIEHAAEFSEPGSPRSPGARFGGEMDRDSFAPHLRQDPGSPLAALSPPLPPPAGTPKDAKLVRNRGNSASNGRLKKLQGDLYLMSGRLTEALAAYTTGMEASAAFHDYLWQAVATEGYCAALLLLCERGSERRLAHAFVVAAPRGAETRASDATPEGLGGLLREVAGLFGQVPALFEKCHTLAPLLHVEACVRAALVLRASREALLGDCDPEAALGSLLHQQNLLHPHPAPVCAVLDVVAQACGAPLRAEISRGLQRGWPGGLAALADQLELLLGVCAIYGRIGYPRKAAFFLRQFLLTSVPVLLRATDRRPAVPESPVMRSSAAGGESALPDGAAAFGAVLSAAAAATQLPGRTTSSGYLRPLPVPRKAARAGGGGSNMSQAIITCLDALAASLARSGWLHLQADGLRGCLALTEALPSPPHAIAFAFRLVRCLGQLADTAPEPQRRALVEELHTVRGYILHTIGSMRHGSAQRPPPASPQPADEPADACVGGRDAAVVGGALDSLLEGVQLCMVLDGSQPVQTDAPASAAAPSLFLYTPGAQTQGDRPLLLAAGERARFVATLRNPLPFALPLSDMALLAEVDSDSGSVTVVPTSCTVPAGGRGQVLLEAVPDAAGRLRVAGVRMRVFQDLQIECTLADENALSAAKRPKERQLHQRLEAERAALLGATATHAPAPSAAQLSPPNAGYALVATVAPPLPHLALAGSTMASEESLALHEGESRTVTLTLVNNSAGVGVDRIEVLFEPPPALMGDQLRNGVDDVVQAALSYRAESARVGPMGTLPLHIRVDGLPGLAGATVVVRYGSSAAAAAGWQRELRVPLHVSVSRLVVAPVRATRYLPLPPYIARAFAGTSAATDGLAAAARDVVAASDRPPEDLYCLAEIDVANAGAAGLRLDVEVDLSHGVSAAPVLRTQHVHVPAGGDTARLAVPLPRVSLSGAALSAPIPGVEADGGPDDSLRYPWRTPLAEPDGAATEKWAPGSAGRGRARQFVVSHTGGPRELAEARAVFWHRRALADRVRIRWTCEQSQRCGYVDPRPLLALDTCSLAVVRPGDVQATLLVDGAPVLRASQHVLQARCAAQKPTDIVFALTNTTTADLRAVFSVRVERSQPPAAPAEGTDAPGARRAERPLVAAAAGVNLSFVAGMQSSSGSGRRLRFCPAVGGLSVPDRPQGSPPHGGAHVPPLPPVGGLALDDIEEMHLPRLTPHATHQLALPMYALLPGRYQIEYSVRSLDCTAASAMRETLVVDAM